MNKLTKPQVKLLAIAAEGEPSRLICMQTVRQDKIITIIPSLALESALSLKKELISKGYSPDNNNTHWKEIHQLLSKDVLNRYQTVLRSGWHGNCYILNNGLVLGSEDKYGPFLIQNKIVFLAPEADYGSIKNWKKNVAPLALCSSRLMLALCAALSGMIVRIAGIESGGFHFFGKSSIGKSSTLLFASSIFGGHSYIKSWNVTEKGLEDMAQIYSDSCLLLDELKSSDRNVKSAAELVQKLTYLLAEGHGKSRAISYQVNVPEWELSVLSTGEYSLEQHLNYGGIERLDGDRVRLIDIPADVGKGYGIYDHLPKNINSGAQLASHLKEICKKYNGTTQYYFVKRLVRDQLEGTGRLKVKISHYMDKFMQKNHIDQNDGIKSRVAKRFALAYAAGILAIEYKLLPFNNKEIGVRLSQCLSDAMDFYSRTDHRVDYQSKIMSFIKSEEPINLLDEKQNYSIEDVNSANVVLAEVNHKKVLAVKPSCIDELIPHPKLRKQVLRKLVDEQIIYPDSEGKNTRQITYKGKGLVRRYCFFERKCIN